MNTKNKRIAIVVDWLIDFGGAELVISHLLELFPDAEIYTSVCFMQHPMLEGRKVHTSWLQKIPFFNKKHKLAGVLRPWAFRSFNLSGYDIILCSTSAESKQVSLGKWRKKSPKTPVIVYCHTPTRYYWSHSKEYENMMEFGLFNPIVRRIFRILKGWMQKEDYKASQKVDYFIANSKNTAERIQKYYHRESIVIYPGIEIPRHREGGSDLGRQKRILMSDYISPQDHNNEKKELSHYYIGVGRCIPYKKFDLLVDAFNANGKKLILCTATDTPLFHELKKKSKSNIEWKFRVSNQEKNRLIVSAQAFLFPPEEDFGLVPLEAMSLGTPVIAYEKGGALETVVTGKTGIFFSPQTPEGLNTAIEKFEKLSFNTEESRHHAGNFSKEVFKENIFSFLERI